MAKRLLVALPALLLISAALAGCAGVGSINDLPKTRNITMWVEEMDWEIHPNVVETVWAFCAEGSGVQPVHGESCGVPGPTIHVNEGDKIVVTFRNDHAIPHTVHFHGWHPYAADMNGNGALGDTMVANPGQEQVIKWTAKPAGSFIYHCHFDTPTHMEKGMYGAFIVHKKGEAHPDVEEVAVLDEWQIRDELEANGNMPAYNFFTINGKSFPLTKPIVADKGDNVRIHMVNAGYEFHAMHIHGYTPDSWEGVAGAKHAVPTDVREIAPGQTVVLDFDADREGIWLMHDHVVPRVTANGKDGGFGVYPRGMLTMVVVGAHYLEKVQELVPALLAAAETDVPQEPSNETHAHEAHDHGDQENEPADAEPPATTVFAAMKDFKFTDSTLEVDAGTRIVWRNNDGAYHTVTDADGAFDSGEIQAGKTWGWTFTEPGIYQIYCKPHAYQQDGEWKGMIATVTVS